MEVYEINGRKIESEAGVTEEDFKEYRKTKTAKAVQMVAPFKVHTMEGIMEGKAGDFLMMGVKGEVYPCDKEVFEDSYEEVKEDAE